LGSTQTLNISVNSSNAAADKDPDFLLFRNGVFVGSGEDSTQVPEVETFPNSAAGTYVIDVYDCANGCTTDQGTRGDYDLTVTVN
jgi:hypothetical protein